MMVTGPSRSIVVVMAPSPVALVVAGLSRQSMRLFHNDFSMAARGRAAHDEHTFGRSVEPERALVGRGGLGTRRCGVFPSAGRGIRRHHRAALEAAVREIAER